MEPRIHPHADKMKPFLRHTRTQDCFSLVHCFLSKLVENMLHLNEGLSYKVGFESRDLTIEMEGMPRLKVRAALDLSRPADLESTRLTTAGTVAASRTAELKD